MAFFKITTLHVNAFKLYMYMHIYIYTLYISVYLSTYLSIYLSIYLPVQYNMYVCVLKSYRSQCKIYAVMKTMRPPSYHRNGFVVINGRSHCFHDCIYIYLYIYTIILYIYNIMMKIKISSTFIILFIVNL